MAATLGDIANPFFACMIKSTQAASHRLGYSLVVCDTNENFALEIDGHLIVGDSVGQQTWFVMTKMLLNMQRPPTAFFATSDLITLGALKALAEEQARVPDGLSLVAFDDLDGVEYFRCPMTAVAQPKEHIGEVAVRLLSDQMKSRETVGQRARRIVQLPLASGMLGRALVQKKGAPLLEQA
jgi:DNA-binding LacI/PurR family transcriptional regulator